VSQPDDSAAERGPAREPDATATNPAARGAPAPDSPAADASAMEGTVADPAAPTGTAAETSLPAGTAAAPGGAAAPGDAAAPSDAAAPASGSDSLAAPAGDQPAPPTIPPQPAQPAYPMALEPPDPNLAGGHTPHHGSAAQATATTAAMPIQHTAVAGYPAGPTPGGRGRTGLVVTSVVAAVALVAAGVLGYLWWDTDRELIETRDQLTAQVGELTQTTADQKEEISGLEHDLQQTRDDLAAAERDLEGARNMVEVLQDEQGVIRRCIALNEEVLDAIFTGNEAAFNAVIDEAEEVCDEADQILGS
jgi:hypothetical protein